MLCVPHLGMPNYGTFWVKTAGPAANITVNGHLIFFRYRSKFLMIIYQHQVTSEFLEAE